MKILSLIAAVGSIVSHGDKAEKTSAFVFLQCKRRSYRGSKINPPTHINCVGVPPKLAH